MRTLIACVFAVFLLAACGDRPDALLLGDWQATQVLEAGDSLRLDPAEIGFIFRPDNRYTFRSTLLYTEAGTWRYEQNHLFATDTTEATNPERVVAVDKLTTDSLVIRMLADGAERELTFLRR